MLLPSRRKANPKFQILCNLIKCTRQYCVEKPALMLFIGLEIVDRILNIKNFYKKKIPMQNLPYQNKSSCWEQMKFSCPLEERECRVKPIIRSMRKLLEEKLCIRYL